METSTAFTFAAGLALGAGAVYVASRHHRRAEAAAGLAGGPVEHADGKPSAPAVPCGRGTSDGSQQASVARFEEDDILSEQLTRNVQFFGLEGQRAIAGAFVVVIGLGVRERARCLPSQDSSGMRMRLRGGCCLPAAYPTPNSSSWGAGGG